MNNQTIKQEYSELNQLFTRSTSLSSLHASALKNTGKNRYSNVLPVEDSRVIVQGRDGDYINANFVTYEKDPTGERLGTFICAQAPLKNTFCHYWSMIWDEKSPVICTLNRLIENGSVKGDLYWPEEPGNTLVFGDILVTLNSTCSLPSMDIMVRRFNITRASELREVFQLHYLGWPDFGVPSSTYAIRELVHLVEWYRKRGVCSGLEGPPVVHCSAGIGRSGSFLGLYFAMQTKLFRNIAYDPEFRKSVENLLSQKREDLLNLEISKHSEQFHVKDIVGSLRRQRNPGMVQNVTQYEFIYLSLHDELRCPCRPSLAVRQVFRWQLMKMDFPKMAMSGLIFGNSRNFKMKYQRSGQIRKLQRSVLRQRLSQSLPGRRK